MPINPAVVASAPSIRRLNCLCCRVFISMFSLFCCCSVNCLYTLRNQSRPGAPPQSSADTIAGESDGSSKNLSLRPHHLLPLRIFASVCASPRAIERASLMVAGSNPSPPLPSSNSTNPRLHARCTASGGVMLISAILIQQSHRFDCFNHCITHFNTQMAFAVSKAWCVARTRCGEQIVFEKW